MKTNLDNVRALMAQGYELREVARALGMSLSEVKKLLRPQKKVTVAKAIRDLQVAVEQWDTERGDLSVALDNLPKLPSSGFFLVGRDGTRFEVSVKEVLP